MDILVIGFTIASWSKYGNLTIRIPSLILSIIEMIAGFVKISEHTDGYWASFVGAICTVLCFVKLFGKKDGGVKNVKK